MTNYAVRSTGHVVAARRMASLPAKIGGQHRWIAIASYVVTPGQAAASAGGAEVTLKPSMLWDLGIGCIDCERTYEEAKSTRCDAHYQEGDAR